MSVSPEPLSFLVTKGDSEMTLTTKEDFQGFSEKISRILKRHEVKCLHLMNIN